MDRPFLTVLMPAYNEEDCLDASARAVLAALRNTGVTSELLIVDDGSTDCTGAIADALAASNRQVRVCHHPANGGIGAGFRTGVEQARGEWFILIPADLALDLGELQKYLDASVRADVVVGVCPLRADYSAYRYLISWLNVRAIQLLFGMKQRQFNYISMYRMEILRRITIQYWRSAFFYAEILIKAQGLGARLVEIELTYVPRAGGRASGARWRLIARTARDMLAFWLSRAIRKPLTMSGARRSH